MKSSHTSNPKQKSDLYDLFDDKFHGWYIRYFIKHNKPDLLSLSIFSVLGFSLVAIPSLYDGVFFYGSVSKIIDAKTHVSGMSFIGDTMVWPFCLFVPILIYLTIMAYSRMGEFIDSCKSGYLYIFSTKDLAEIAENTKNILSGKKHYNVSKYIFPAAWSIAVLIILFNTITCGFGDLFPNLYPYRHHEAAGIAGTHPTESLRHSILLPKWDCQLTDAKSSNVAARLWVIVFYSFSPIIFGYIARIFISMIYFCSKTLDLMLKQVETQNIEQGSLIFFAENIFRIRDVLLKLSTIILISIFVISTETYLAAFRESVSLSWHNVFLAAIVPVALALPLIKLILKIRVLIVVPRNQTLAIIDKKIDHEVAMILGDIGGSTHGARAIRLKALMLLHERTAAIPAYPTNHRQLTNATLTLVGSAVAAEVMKRIPALLGVE